MSQRNTSLRRIAPLLAIICCGPGALSSLPRPVRAEATGPLATAKTITVKERWLTAKGFGDPLTPNCDVTVRIERPDKVRVTIYPAGEKDTTVFYVADGGKVEHEYNGFDNSYKELDATPDAHAHSALRGLSAVELILNPDPDAKIEKDAKSVVTHETLDGKAMTLRTEIRDLPNGLHTEDKFWYDASTGFPYRRSSYITVKGKTELAHQLDFSGWEIDKPQPASTFAFAPPAGSHLFPKLLSAGMTAPDFTAFTPEGKSVHLSDYKGKIVVLDFWATWCGPCQQSMPHLEKVWQQVKDKDVVVLAVCVWDKKPDFDKWVGVHLGKQYSFPIAFDPTTSKDPKNIPGALYGVTGIPTQYVIDRDGKVAASTTGYGDGDHRLEESLRLLKIDVPAVDGAPAVATAASAH